MHDRQARAALQVMALITFMAVKLILLYFCRMVMIRSSILAAVLYTVPETKCILDCQIATVHDSCTVPVRVAYQLGF